MVLHLLILRLSLLRRSIEMVSAEWPRFFHEGDIRLRKGLVQRSILKSDNVIRDKPLLLHISNHFTEVWPTLKEPKKRNLQDDLLAFLEDLSRSV